ncbi:MAG: peptidase S41 [Elusimicrobia bacterium HGW-Elusimicrobia-1]|jgi:carboxyl-terminal processing protease|nr:MAG: peptidase S41 [Elusimicrobia bacterium HGW-Elusimicrobia-1]
MNKKITIALCAAAFLGAVLSSPRARQPLASASAKIDQTYEQLRLLVDIMTIVRENYVEEKENKDLVTSAIKGMVRDLDPFSQFLEPREYKDMKTETEGQFGGLGIRISVRDNWLTVVTPIPGTPAYKLGILPGDKIIKIEKESTQGMSVNDAVGKLRGTPGTKVTITIAREGEKEPVDYTITRDVIKIDSIRHKTLKGDYGYIKINEFSASTDKDLKKALAELTKQNVKYLVLDLRNNPGGLLDVAVDTVKEFLPSDKLVVYTKGRRPHMNREYKTGVNSDYVKLPMAVLINKGSASGSEIFAGALQDHKRAIIVGMESFGKASVQSVFPMTDGNALRLTTAKYYTPSGKLIHRDEKTQEGGIKPDVVVEVSRDTEVKLQSQSEEIYPPGKEPESAVKDKERVEDVALSRAMELLKVSDILAR